MCIFSTLAFHLNFLDSGITRLFLFFLGLIFFAAFVGIAVCALAFRFGGRAHVGATSIVSLLILLSGIYYPVEILPDPTPFSLIFHSIDLFSRILPLLLRIYSEEHQPSPFGISSHCPL